MSLSTLTSLLKTGLCAALAVVDVLAAKVERLRKDERAEKTLAALQREGLWADVRDIKAAQDTLSTQLQQLETQKQAVISNAPEQTQQLQDLQFKPDVFHDSLKDGCFGPEMVVIPAGQFRMGDIQGTGDNNEKPVHEVSVKQFAIGRYELTVAEFRQFVEATAYKTEAEKRDGCYVWKEDEWQKVKDANWRNPSFPKKAPQEDNQPVVCISWNDTKAYIDWLTEQTGQAYRLPSEAQWEYAARAGTDTDYWWGNKFARSRVNCRGSGRPSRWSGKQTAPVGSFKPNPFGLYDTAGNVWEWCADGWHDNYKGAPTDGTVWKGAGSLFVLRGGSWNSGATQVRSAYREKNQQTYGAGNCGVRLAMIL
jgi:formylglycine-generating enzyme required for sulfatase activity